MDGADHPGDGSVHLFAGDYVVYCLYDNLALEGGRLGLVDLAADTGIELAGDVDLAGIPEIAEALIPAPPRETLRRVRLWTDDYSNLLRAVVRF